MFYWTFNACSNHEKIWTCLRKMNSLVFNTFSRRVKLYSTLWNLIIIYIQHEAPYFSEIGMYFVVESKSDSFFLIFFVFTALGDHLPEQNPICQ